MPLLKISHQNFERIPTFERIKNHAKSYINKINKLFKYFDRIQKHLWINFSHQTFLRNAN